MGQPCLSLCGVEYESTLICKEVQAKVLSAVQVLITLLMILTSSTCLPFITPTRATPASNVAPKHLPNPTVTMRFYVGHVIWLIRPNIRNCSSSGIVEV